MTPAWTSYQVVRDDDPTSDPPTGDVLRIYRLALITDPGYAAFFGGSANVTPAKVTLINRVTQLYEDDISIQHWSWSTITTCSTWTRGRRRSARTGHAALRAASRSRR